LFSLFLSREGRKGGVRRRKSDREGWEDERSNEEWQYPIKLSALRNPHPSSEVALDGVV
jgi:hypothetical protein